MDMPKKGPKMGGLLIEVDSGKQPPMEEEEHDEFGSYAQDVWDAIQDDDFESFKLALKGALECM